MTGLHIKTTSKSALVSLCLSAVIALFQGGCGSRDADNTDESDHGYEDLFNGRDLTGWIGDLDSYGAADGVLYCVEGGHGNLYFNRPFSDFDLRFEFRLTPGANNGIGIRAELERDAAFYGIEVQVIDEYSKVWSDLKPWQYHGSLYGLVPARRGMLRPAGEWNREFIRAVGPRVTVTLNDSVVVDANLEEFRDRDLPDGSEHPGLFNRTGYIGLLGHGDRVEFRRIRIRDLAAPSPSWPE
jgi:hypothetical protein